MSLQDLQRHFLNMLLVVKELPFVLSEEDLRQLSEDSGPARVHQRPHKKRLIYVAHAHLVFEEVNKVFVFHGRWRYGSTVRDVPLNDAGEPGGSGWCLPPLELQMHHWGNAEGRAHDAFGGS